jgi:hypothetical protein
MKSSLGVLWLPPLRGAKVGEDMSKLKSISLLAVLTGAVVSSTLGPATAQAVTRAIVSGEVIQQASGQPVGFWSKTSTCNKAANACGATLINSETGEVAMYAGQLASAFSRTGVGEEIRRVSAATTLGRKAD